MHSRSEPYDRAPAEPGRPSPPVAVLAWIGALHGWRLSERLLGGAGVFLIGLTLRLHLFGPTNSSFPYVTYLPAVAVATALFGRAGGLLVAVFALVAAPALAPASDGVDWLRFAGFCVSSLVVVAAAELARLAQARLHVAGLAQQDEALLTHFIEQAPAAMAMFDRDMRYLATSRRWRTQFCSEQDPVGVSHYQLFPEMPAHWRQAHARGLAGETLRADRELFLREDGQRQWVCWEIQPWRRQQGDIGGIVIYAEDISERVREQEQTRQSEAALRALGDNLPDSVVYRFTHDPDGAPRFLHISAGVARLNGVSVEEVLADGRKLMSQVLPEFSADVAAAEAEALRNSADFAFDAPMRRPDGEVRWMRMRARPDPRSDGAAIWNGVYMDVTDEMRQVACEKEEARRQGFVLELADALKPLSDPLDIMAVAGETLGRRLACQQVVYCEIDERQQFATTTREWTDGAMPTSLGVHRLADFGPELIARLQAGCVNIIDDTAADPHAGSDLCANTYRAREIGAFVAAPLIKGERLVAVLSIHQRASRRWSALDLALIGETAERTWAAVERARAAGALRDSEERLRFALRAANAGVWSWNLHTNKSIWSDELWKLYGRDPGSAEPSYTEWLQSVHPDDRERIDGIVKLAVLRGSDLDFEWRSTDASGAERWLLTRAAPLYNENGPAERYVGVAIDITDRKKSEQRIGYLAHHDTLTGLPNRTAFNQRLAAAVAGADASRTSVALVCMDLDRFKEVNDVFGHAVGDELLRRVADALLGAARGARIARVGGDEFVTLIEGKDPAADAAALAARLRDAVAAPFEIDGRRLSIGLSVGVALYPDHGDIETALANADAALYRAKAVGGGNVCLFDSGLDSRLRARNALFQDLGKALEHGELSVHYQPQARLDGEIFGFEALVRWRHPTRGYVPPDMFVPLAEERGLIGAIGEFVLREACREAASWPVPLSVAVNLSPVQFQKDGLINTVHAILLETGLPANRLELEITEGVLVDDFSRASAILRQLKAIGARVAIDDFGAGYSSLAYLQSFPFDKIKIDRSFVSGLPEDASSQAIVRAIVALGRGLNLPLIAEGVETRAQLEYLDSLGCSEAQGFLFGAPQPIAGYAAAVGRKVAGRARRACEPTLTLAFPAKAERSA
jgi:diguanylate cyclase (GGDEF)-like protein/PAS domain S-box-containing protein